MHIAFSVIGDDSADKAFSCFEIITNRITTEGIAAFRKYRLADDSPAGVFNSMSEHFHRSEIIEDVIRFQTYVLIVHTGTFVHLHSLAPDVIDGAVLSRIRDDVLNRAFIGLGTVFALEKGKSILSNHGRSIRRSILRFHAEGLDCQQDRDENYRYPEGLRQQARSIFAQYDGIGRVQNYEIQLIER